MKIKIPNNDKPGFYWISGGCTYQSFGGVLIQAKEKKRQGNYSELSYKDGTVIKLKDREIYVCKPGFPERNFIKTGLNWDYLVDANFTNTTSAIPHRYIMFTYKKTKSDRLFYPKENCRKFVFADSGGFQIFNNKIDFVDPVDLGAYYIKHADLGMALDIPFSSGIYRDTLTKLAKIQKKNLDILWNNVDDTVQLYNIAHGFDSESIKRYIDLVDRPGVDRWAIGLHENRDYQSLITHFYTVFRHRPAKTYHLLGTSDTKLIPILAWIGRYRSLSCDSSSAMQSGIHMCYFSLQGYHLKKIQVGWKNNNILQSLNTFAPMTCLCPICKALSTFELFFYNKIDSVGPRLLTLHNINIMAQYTQAWSELALEAKSVQEFQEHIKHIDNRNGEIAKAIDYIERLENGGNVIDIGETIIKDTSNILYNRTLKKFIRRYTTYHVLRHRRRNKRRAFGVYRRIRH